MTFEQEIERLRRAGYTYLQVEIGSDDVTLSGPNLDGRGRTLDEAERHAQRHVLAELDRLRGVTR